MNQATLPIYDVTDSLCEPPVLSLAWQLALIPASERKPIRFNPRPAGVIREGSASDAVLKFLRESCGYRTEAQMLWKTQRSHSAVSWALLYLIRQGLVESRGDATRSTRYKKYRAVRVYEDQPAANLGQKLRRATMSSELSKNERGQQLATVLFREKQILEARIVEMEHNCFGCSTRWAMLEKQRDELLAAVRSAYAAETNPAICAELAALIASAEPV